MTPRLRGYNKPETVVLDYDLAAGKYERYDMGQRALNQSLGNEEAVFSTNGSPEGCYLTKRNKGTGEIQSLELMEYFSYIGFEGDTLYAFTGSITGARAYYMHLIDPDELKILETYEITEMGYSVDQVLRIGEYVYFCPAVKADVNSTAATNLIRFDPRDGSFRETDLGHEYPNKMVEYNGKILISHLDMAGNIGTGMTLYDPVTDEFQYIPTEYNVMQMELVGDTLYYCTRGDDTTRMGAWDISKIESGKLEEVVPLTDVLPHKKKNDYPHFYTIGFFMNTSKQEN